LSVKKAGQPVRPTMDENESGLSARKTDRLSVLRWTKTSRAYRLERRTDCPSYDETKTSRAYRLESRTDCPSYDETAYDVPACTLLQSIRWPISRDRFATIRSGRNGTFNLSDYSNWLRLSGRLWIFSPSILTTVYFTVGSSRLVSNSTRPNDCFLL